MTVGQMSETLVLGLVPLLVARGLSRKSLLGLGLLAYALRMALFAYVDQLPLPAQLTLILGVALHGFCFGCFIFVSFMVVDENTSPDVRASAPGEARTSKREHGVLTHAWPPRYDACESHSILEHCSQLGPLGATHGASQHAAQVLQ